jgi:spectinomycin phosphotransferase
VHDSQGGQWFVTVDDLDSKRSWLGETRVAAAEGLRAAFDTAFALRHHAGLRFVVAPIPALHGETVLPLGPKYTVAVFPFIHGASGRFGEKLPAGERAHLVDMLAALHRSTSTAAQASVRQIALRRRGTLETALSELSQPWHGGPFSEPARALLTGTAEPVRHLLETFDQLAERMTTALEPVITHGEPHPANFIRAGTGRMLVDWDTVGLAPPERDLWIVASDIGEESRRYTRATGRRVDPAALALYRIRWALDDISAFVEQFRTPHRRSADTEHMWLSLNDVLARARP